MDSVPKSDNSDDMSFVGSHVVVVGDSIEQVREDLRKDVYATSGVWDVENVSEPYSRHNDDFDHAFRLKSTHSALRGETPENFSDERMSILRDGKGIRMQQKEADRY